MLRLYSDVRFAPDLSLRIDLRDHGGLKASAPIGHSHFAIGEPQDVVETPFLTSRFYYDIPLPGSDRLVGGHRYNLLLRMVNTEGFSVSEEQQVEMVWPVEGLRSAAEGCSIPALEGTPQEGSTADFELTVEKGSRQQGASPQNRSDTSQRLVRFLCDHPIPQGKWIVSP